MGIEFFRVLVMLMLIILGIVAVLKEIILGSVVMRRVKGYIRDMVEVVEGF